MEVGTRTIDIPWDDSSACGNQMERAHNSNCWIHSPMCGRPQQRARVSQIGKAQRRTLRLQTPGEPLASSKERPQEDLAEPNVEIRITTIVLQTPHEDRAAHGKATRAPHQTHETHGLRPEGPAKNPQSRPEATRIVFFVFWMGCQSHVKGAAALLHTLEIEM